MRGSPAYAERRQYGEPCASGGPSGSVCQTLKPPAARKSTNRRACAPSVPVAPLPGSEPTCSRTPALRRSRAVIGNRPWPRVRSGAQIRPAGRPRRQHVARDEHDALLGHVEALLVRLAIVADHGAVRDEAPFVDDRVRDPATAADL